VPCFQNISGIHCHTLSELPKFRDSGASVAFAVCSGGSGRPSRAARLGGGPTVSCSLSFEASNCRTVGVTHLRAGSCPPWVEEGRSCHRPARQRAGHDTSAAGSQTPQSALDALCHFCAKSTLETAWKPVPCPVSKQFVTRFQSTAKVLIYKDLEMGQLGLGSWHSTTELRPQPYFTSLSGVARPRQVPLRPVACHVSPVASRYLPANFQITSSSQRAIPLRTRGSRSPFVPSSPYLFNTSSDITGSSTCDGCSAS
jgi:hypothetical protein